MRGGVSITLETMGVKGERGGVIRMRGKSLILEHGNKIGKSALWNTGGAIKVIVTILDAKNAFGHIRFLISPVAGTGEQWVDEKYLEFTTRKGG